MSREARAQALSMIVAAAVAAAALASVPAAAQRPEIAGFADLTDRLSPAVVNIRTSQNVKGGLPKFGPGSPLEKYNDFLSQAPRTESSLGSGFVIDPKGVIVTNNHVVEGADAIEVAFQDGRSLEATVVGRDAATDLAVLKVVADAPLPFVPFGDSDKARVGDWVIAIGNPFGLGQTLTVGVISARNRDIKSGSYDDFIQTDASINRGNSGGPLFNLDGQVIGVNSAILSPSGGSVGIGFSIPSQLAQSIVDQLLQYGETRRGWLGVNIQRVTPEIAESYGLDKARGALVIRVSEKSPAAAAGLRPGDLVVAFDGKDVVDDRYFTRMVADTEVGREVPIQYVRDMKLQLATVKIDRLTESEAGKAVQEQAPPEVTGSADTVLGVTVAPVSAETRRTYGLADDVEGVVVTFVQSGTDAAGKLRVGDVIEEVAFERVTTPAAAAEAASAAAGGGKPILLLLNRDGQPVFESVRAAKG